MDSSSGYSSFGQRSNSNPNGINIINNNPVYLNPNSNNINSHFASFRLAAAAAAAAQKKEESAANTAPKKDEIPSEESKIQKPASTLKDVIHFLRRADLFPVSFQPNKRSWFAGLLNLLLLPSLILYIAFTIEPIYGPLPVCCICASPSTPTGSWLLQANTPPCIQNDTCVGLVQSNLENYCNIYFNYQTPPTEFRYNVDFVGCPDISPGQSCSAGCKTTSKEWSQSQNYTATPNSFVAQTRCGPQGGVCQLRSPSGRAATFFGRTLCQFPEPSDIVVAIGSRLALLQGLIVFVSLGRAVWNQLQGTQQEPGRTVDYVKGAVLVLVFNYFGLGYLLLAPQGVTKKMRYGGQMVFGLILFFAGSAAFTFSYYLFELLLPALAMLFISRTIGYAFCLRSVYSILIQNRQQSKIEFEYRQQQISRPESAARADEIPQLTFDHKWKSFFIGVFTNLFALPFLLSDTLARVLLPGGLRVLVQEKQGFAHGAVVGSCLALMAALWSLLFALDWWSYVTFEFPFAFSSNPGTTALVQSAYAVVTSILLFTATLAQGFFFSGLPEMNTARATSTTPLLQQSGKKQKEKVRRFQRLGFVLAGTPAAVGAIAFLSYYLRYLVINPFDSGNECSPELWPSILAICSVLPGVLAYFGVRLRPAREGMMEATGVALLVIGNLLWIMSHNSCLLPNAFCLLAWVYEAVGGCLLLYGVLKPELLRWSYSDAKLLGGDDSDSEEAVFPEPAPSPSTSFNQFPFFPMASSSSRPTAISPLKEDVGAEPVGYVSFKHSR